MSMEKERPREDERKAPPEPDPPPEIRDDLAREVHAEASPTRCPYCHERIELKEESWLACEACLARHHEACWTEGGRCSSCGSTAPLARTGHPVAAPRPASEVQDAWLRELEALVMSRGFPYRLSPIRQAPPSPPPGGLAKLLFGKPLGVERSRTFEGVAPATRCGSWGNGFVTLTIEAQGDRTTVRAGVNTGGIVGGAYGGLVGGLGGGLGGGLSYLAHQLGGGPGVVACNVSCCVLAAMLARLVVVTTVGGQERKLESIVKDIEDLLAGKPSAS